MKIKHILLACVMLALGTSCEKEFLDNQSTTSPTLDTYYKNASEVRGATALLYTTVWGDWSDKAFTSVGDVLGGTITGTQGNDQYNSFYNFNIQSTDGLVGATWRSCYKAAGSASILIKVFENKKKTLGDEAFLTQGIAEARFIRAFAYFYIGRTFGDAPIVEDPAALAEPGKYLVPRYKQADVLRFAIEDLKFAEANLPVDAFEPGRVTKYSAKGMMSKIYLYLKDYVNAKAKAKEVIDYANSTGKIALADYNALFTSSSVSRNNKETLFALRWEASLVWNGGNRFGIYAAPMALNRPAPSGGDGYSSIVPSFAVLNSTTGYTPGDKRREWSVMEHGFTRADWKNASYPNGFKYDTTGKKTDEVFTFTGTRSNIQKYVAGPNRAGEALSANGHNSISTQILRYADILLIYAEAVLAGGTSTSDPTALDAFNAVHTRANLTPVTTSITIDDILHERKVEFALKETTGLIFNARDLKKQRQLLQSRKEEPFRVTER